MTNPEANGDKPRSIIAVGGLFVLAGAGGIAGASMVDLVGKGSAGVGPVQVGGGAASLSLMLLGYAIGGRRAPTTLLTEIGRAAGRAASSLRENLGFKLALSASALLLSLLVLETVLRFSTIDFRRSPWEINPDVGYEFARHATYGGDTLNSEGFRNPEVSVTKGPGEYRVLVLGDSVAYSTTARREWSWPRQVERALASLVPSRQVRVLNGGVPGYVSAQVLKRLIRHGLKYSPAVVVVLVGWNDMGYSSLSEWRPNVDATQLRFAWGYQRRHVLFGSRVLGIVNDYIQEVRHAKPLYPTRAGTRQDSGIAFNEEALRLYLENLDAIRREAESRGARLVLIVPPTLLNLKPYPADIEDKTAVTFGSYPLSLSEWEAWYGRYRDALVRYGASHDDVRLVDPTDDFAAAPNRHDLFWDMGHLSEPGNQVLAASVIGSLVKVAAEARVPLVDRATIVRRPEPD